VWQPLLHTRKICRYNGMFSASILYIIYAWWWLLMKADTCRGIIYGIILKR
jgi:hypothetical protein